jgi:hypothetical protein
MQEAACGGNEVVSAEGDWSRGLTTQRSKLTCGGIPPSSRCELRRVIRLWSMPGGARLAIDRAGNDNPD